MKVLYFGSDALSLRVLSTLKQVGMTEKRLIKDLQVVSPPDRLAGKRQRAMTPCVLKAGALDLGLRVLDAPVTAPRPTLPEWDSILMAQKKEIQADLAVVFSFGNF